MMGEVGYMATSYVGKQPYDGTEYDYQPEMQLRAYQRAAADDVPVQLVRRGVLVVVERQRLAHAEGQAGRGSPPGLVQVRLAPRLADAKVHRVPVAPAPPAAPAPLVTVVRERSWGGQSGGDAMAFEPARELQAADRLAGARYPVGQCSTVTSLMGPLGDAERRESKAVEQSAPGHLQAAGDRCRRRVVEAGS